MSKRKIAKQADAGELLLRRILERAYVSALYYSGKLETDYLRAISSGASPWTILRYERIIDPEKAMFPPSLHQYVRPKAFEQQVKFLHQRCRVIALPELIEQLERGKPILPKTVVLTFDSGWVDTYSNALPILRKYRLPATVFVATQFIGTSSSFWPEKLMAAVLSLFYSGQGLKSVPMIESYFPGIHEEGEEDLATTILRATLLTNNLQRAELHERVAVLAAVGLAVDAAGGFAFERAFLSWEELRTLHHSGISVGTSGHQHIRSFDLSREDFLQDVRSSYQLLRDQSITPLEVFSFPEGVVSSPHREFLAEQGVKYCVSSGVRRDADRKELPEHFARHLDRTFIYQAAGFCRELFAYRMWKQAQVVRLKEKEKD